jgi:hypothetical protein
MSAIQVQAYINGAAKGGVIHNALEAQGTPNRLLQTILTLMATVSFQPPSLDPVVLFQGSFQVSTAQTLTLRNSGNKTVTFNVTFPPPPLPPLPRRGPNGVTVLP